MSHLLTPQIPFVLAASCLALMATACDTDQPLDAIDHIDAIEAVDADNTTAVAIASNSQLPHESEVPWPELDELNTGDLLGQAPIQAGGFWTIEAFYFTAQPDFISVTSPPGGLFAPLPADIQALPQEQPGSFMLTFQLRDFGSNVVGYGTLLEDLDFATLTGEDTYSLMIPGRGSIAFTQQEDFAWVFDLIGDMVADQVTVRDYDPPVFNEGSIPGTVQLLGGSGEFEGIQGYAREIQFVEQFNLETGVHDVGTILLVAHPS